MAMNRSFPVVLLPQTAGGCFVQWPGLPGCYSQGETVEEAIELVLEDMAATGEIPACSGPAILTEVTIAA